MDNNKNNIWYKALIALVLLLLVVGGWLLYKKWAPADNDYKTDKKDSEISIPKNENIQPFNPNAPAFNEVVVVANEFSFTPSIIDVKVGERVRLIFRNQGEDMHNMKIDGLGLSTKTISGGQVDVIDFTAPATGIYDFICSVADHRLKGMRGQLRSS